MAILKSIFLILFIFCFGFFITTLFVSLVHVFQVCCFFVEHFGSTVESNMNKTSKAFSFGD